MKVADLRVALFTDTSALDHAIRSFELIAKVMPQTAQTFLDRNSSFRAMYEHLPDINFENKSVIRVAIGPSPKLAAFIAQFAPEDVSEQRADDITSLHTGGV